MSRAPSTYKNVLAALKNYYREYLGLPGLVETKLPRPSISPKVVPGKGGLQRFYQCIKIYIGKNSSLRRPTMDSLKDPSGSELFKKEGALKTSSNAVAESPAELVKTLKRLRERGASAGLPEYIRHKLLVEV